MTEIPQIEVQVGRQGRLVIPAALRRALELAEGDTLLARVEDERLVLEKRATIQQRLKARFAAIPPDINLTDELISERRAEYRRENSP
jgi:AbrB family looped-hinge helix DNA binding protein